MHPFKDRPDNSPVNEQIGSPAEARLSRCFRRSIPGKAIEWLVPAPVRVSQKTRLHMVDATISGMRNGRLTNVASNESALGTSPFAVAAAREAAENIERYPDNGPGRLAEKIGETRAGLLEA